MKTSKKKSKKQLNAYNMASIGIMAALMCALGPLSIPIGPVPISLTNLVIYITLYALGMKRATICCFIYLLAGFVGMPVFSGFTSGPGKLLGPTGGYLVGFIFMTLVGGYFVDKFINKWYLCFVGLSLGTLICYAFGTSWLSYQSSLTLGQALWAGVIPFIPGDLLKISLSTYFGPKIRNRLNKANLYHT